MITNASAADDKIRALVYIAAYAPDEGETLSEAGLLGGGSTELTKHLLLRPYPGAPDGDIDPEYFHELFCADVEAKLATFMAFAQRGVAVSGLVTPSGAPGWRTIPSVARRSATGGGAALAHPRGNSAVQAHGNALSLHTHITRSPRTPRSGFAGSSVVM